LLLLNYLKNHTVCQIRGLATQHPANTFLKEEPADLAEQPELPFPVSFFGFCRFFPLFLFLVPSHVSVDRPALTS